MRGEIHAYTLLVLTTMVLPCVLLLMLFGSRPANVTCMRVILHLPVPTDWRTSLHQQPHASGLCRIAERLDTERTHGH